MKKGKEFGSTRPSPPPLFSPSRHRLWRCIPSPVKSIESIKQHYHECCMCPQTFHDISDLINTRCIKHKPTNLISRVGNIFLNLTFCLSFTLCNVERTILYPEFCLNCNKFSVAQLKEHSDGSKTHHEL